MYRAVILFGWAAGGTFTGSLAQLLQGLLTFGNEVFRRRTHKPTRGGGGGGASLPGLRGGGSETFSF